MSFKNENTSVISQLQDNGNDVFAYVKDPVTTANEHGLYMVPCVKRGTETYSISSNVPIPGNCLVKLNLRHFSQYVDRNGLKFKSHQYVINMKDPLIIQL